MASAPAATTIAAISATASPEITINHPNTISATRTGAIASPTAMANWREGPRPGARADDHAGIVRAGAHGAKR